MKPVRFNKVGSQGRCFHRPAILRALIALFPAIMLLTALHGSAQAETRTLKMYFTHTKESTTFTFKKNGKYVQSGLKKANRFLRDWRRKEPTKMDPALLDLVWEVYQRSGSRKPIHVISGYRSPRTNKMLRRRGRNVAKNSQHTRGKALDFFMPDVSVAKLRALGLKAHRGGVGYYRGSFVHLDTGRVRHWPRMSSKQLAKVFPRGKTIHVPSNGKALKGFKTAKLNLSKGLNADGSKRSVRGRKRVLAKIFAAKDDKKKKKIETPPAKKPVPKKPSGPDPFSLENVAGNRKADEDKQRREKELAAAKKAREAETARAAKLARDEAEKQAKQVAAAAKKAQEIAAAKRAQEVAEAAKLAQEAAAAERAKRLASAAQRAQEALAARRAQELATAKKEEQIATASRAREAAQAARLALKLAEEKRAEEVVAAESLAQQVAAANRAQQVAAAAQQEQKLAAARLAEQLEAAKLAEEVVARLAYDDFGAVPSTGRLTVPSLRPGSLVRIAQARADAAKASRLARQERADLLVASLQPPVPSELILAAPSSLTEPLRPTPATLSAQADDATRTVLSDDNKVQDLTRRIETALVEDKKLTPVERAAELQGNTELAEALKSIPVPSARAQQPAAIQLALSRSVQQTASQSALRAALAAAELSARDGQSVATPSWRSAAFRNQKAISANAFQVPLPSDKSKAAPNKPVLTGFARQSDSLSSEHLSLGDLDGNSVKAWAVSKSTRVGASASLTAPIYEQSTKRAAPHAVYSIGFANIRFPLRSDRFSGRALTRVAFAQFGQNQ